MELKTKIRLEGIRILPGGKFDNTKVTSPDIIFLKKQKIYRIFYVGTSCKLEERKDYHILCADSFDGLHFTKREQPIIDIDTNWGKVYSPNVILINDIYRMYFSACIDGIYKIKLAVSKNCLNFKVNEGIIIDVDANHKKAVHTPKIILRDKYYCYYTGSNDNQKIYSRKYPLHDFGKDFRIFLATSDNGIHFKFRRIASIEESDFINYYGHNVFQYKKRIFLFFTGFDGDVNSIFVSRSKNGVDFDKPHCILTPNEKNGEIGIYSCSLIRIRGNVFRIYYGIRYIDNHWTINSALFDIEKLFKK